jgi:hypothetical protein
VSCSHGWRKVRSESYEYQELQVVNSRRREFGGGGLTSRATVRASNDKPKTVIPFTSTGLIGIS